MGLQVSRLIRTAYGPFTIEGMEPGDAEEIAEAELRSFRTTLKMRIIAGEWRGRAIEAPPGSTTRPTADRVRETLFSMLVSRLGSFDELRVADLFAGSGALGLEALSRGAASATFVESDAKAAAAIRRNAEKLGASDRVRVIAGSALSLPRSEPFDLIFADPPYAAGSGTAVVASIAAGGWLAPRRLAERRNQPRRCGRCGRAHPRGSPRRRPRAAYAFAPPLAAFRISSISVADAAADRCSGSLSGFLHRLAGALAAAPSPPLVKPCSASEASAAVAATATNSATSGL